MKIKVDENLPIEVAEELRNHAHDVATVPEEGLAGFEDSVIWKAALAENRVLLTQDLDFSDMRRYGAVAHSGIVVLRLRKATRERIIKRCIDLFSQSVDWSGCYVTATEQKLRIRRPNQRE
jgi:predicted nuclease of predicted toxin-antitoxin system